MTEWVRYYHDTPTDPKWRVIAKKAGARLTDVLAVWNMVLVNASANANERGRTHSMVPDDIGAALDLEATLVEAILDAMKGKVMDARGYLTGWEKRNPIKDDGASERAKRWRERKRTQTNGANALDTDTDTDTDKKKETLPDKSGGVVAAKVIPEDFETFWKTYDGPKNSKKPDALKAWAATAKIRPPLPDLLRAVVNYSAWITEESRKQKRDYPKQHHATWLRGEMWNNYGEGGAALTAAEIEANKDRADRIMGRGKYAQGMT